MNVNFLITTAILLSCCISVAHGQNEQDISIQAQIQELMPPPAPPESPPPVSPESPLPASPTPELPAPKPFSQLSGKEMNDVLENSMNLSDADQKRAADAQDKVDMAEAAKQGKSYEDYRKEQQEKLDRYNAQRFGISYEELLKDRGQ